MKIWITRQSTGSLHAGGLERLQVWFQRPYYTVGFMHANEVPDLPFGYGELEGLGTHDWHCGSDHNYPQQQISFAKMFGYSGSGCHTGYVEGLSEYVWKKLNEHYGNTRYVDGWYKYESEGKCKRADFLLEIDLDIVKFTHNER